MTPQFPSISAASAPKLAENWFEYLVQAHPHHTDYGGVVWHGSYIAWMEEARVECLRSLGVEFADLVALNCDLPVVELSVRYHRPVRMGVKAIVKVRMARMTGVRINCDYQIQAVDNQKKSPEKNLEGSLETCVTARVALVAIDRQKGRIMRQLPPILRDALIKFSTSS